MDRKEIMHLASLARIKVTDEECDHLSKEFDAILGYVDAIKEITSDTTAEKSVGVHFNVLREDGEPDEPGIYTEKLLNAAPRRRGDYIEVKKVLDNE